MEVLGGNGVEIQRIMLGAAAAAIMGQAVLVVAVTVIKALTLQETEITALQIQVVAVVARIRPTAGQI
tara:strand:- start:8 stop:211 length:204 start_codon:yes stop_codon:yes gene_type:complete